ncbi:MAG: hypothetical protein WC119_01455 [Synergistaceae bacterium]
MKLLKSKNGKGSVKMSKSEWRSIGAQQGWTKGKRLLSAQASKAFSKFCQNRSKFYDLLKTAELTLSESELKEGLKNNLYLYGYGTEFYFTGSNLVTEISMDEAKDSIAGIIAEQIIRDPNSELLGSIEAHIKAGKSFNFAVSYDKNKPAAKELNFLYNGFAVPTSFRFICNAALKNRYNIFKTDKVANLTKRDKIDKTDVEPIYKQRVRTFDDALEAANAAGLVAGNCSMIFCTKKRRQDVRSGPSQSLAEKVYKWLSYSPTMSNKSWTNGLFSENSKVGIEHLQKALTYLTTITSEYKKVRAGEAQEILLSRRDECRQLAAGFGLLDEYEKLGQAAETANEQPNYNQRWFILDFSHHIDKILEFIFRETPLIAIMLEAGGGTREDAMEMAQEAFFEGVSGISHQTVAEIPEEAPEGVAEPVAVPEEAGVIARGEMPLKIGSIYNLIDLS